MKTFDAGPLLKCPARGRHVGRDRSGPPADEVALHEEAVLAALREIGGDGAEPERNM